MCPPHAGGGIGPGSATTGARRTRRDSNRHRLVSCIAVPSAGNSRTVSGCYIMFLPCCGYAMVWRRRAATTIRDRISRGDWLPANRPRGSGNWGGRREPPVAHEATPHHHQIQHSHIDATSNRSIPRIGAIQRGESAPTRRGQFKQHTRTHKTSLRRLLWYHDHQQEAFQN
jgi:hypothetical protein